VHLPLLLLSPESHRLLEAGPRQRRRFLDWGVFHHSTGFLDLWRRFQIALRQRNSALRAAAPAQVVGAWDPELRQCAQGMDALRQAYAVRLEAAVSSLAGDMLALDDLSLKYRRGWDARQDYGELLAAGYEQDSRCGYTRMGPHRADLQLRAGGRAAISWVSRGQQKMLVAAMIIAQAGLYAEHHGAHCLLLVDDLASELDRRHRQALLSALQRSRAQLFVTTIEPALLDCSQWSQHRIFRLADGALVA
jgi:DNA replication and repair protein RecF